MLNQINVVALENRLVMLEARLIILKASFYKEVTHSVNEALNEFEMWRCNDGGYTHYSCFIQGLVRRLVNVLATKGIPAMLEVYESWDYSEQCQLNSAKWRNTAVEIFEVEAQLKETKKQFLIAKQNNQMELALKEAGL